MGGDDGRERLAHRVPELLTRARVPAHELGSGDLLFLRHLLLEATLEARVETWGSFPSITPYTGATYTDKMNAFYAQEIALAQYAKSKLKWYNVMGSVGKTCGWSGFTYGQHLTVTMLEEYFASRGGALPEPRAGDARRSDPQPPGS